MDQHTRELTTLRFDGPRFEDHGLDIDVLPELIAYKTLLVETAKSLWRTQHPDKTRLPKNFEATLSVKFYRLTSGSTGVPLHRALPEHRGNLSLLEDELDQAAEILEATIENAGAGTPLPPALPKNVIPLFGELGRTLQPREFIGIRCAKRTAEVRLTAEVRDRLSLIAEGDYEDSLEIIGEVRATDIDGFTFTLREEDGTKVRGHFEPEQEQLFTEALREHSVRLLRVRGVGEFSGATGRLKAIRKVSSLQSVAREGLTYDDSVPPIWETIGRIAAEVPATEWAKLPRDGARRHDQYLHDSE